MQADSARQWRWAVIRVCAALAAAGGIVWATLDWMTSTPGVDPPGPTPALTRDEQALGDRLMRHVEHLSVQIGRRNASGGRVALAAAATYVEGQLFHATGLPVRSEPFELTGADTGGLRVRNLISELPGTTHPEQIVVVGAHYDSAEFTPGADDNATGAAALIELARLLHRTPAARTLRFVAFVNEEPPWFGTEEMGSRVHARGCTDREEDVTAMLSLEMLGFFTDAPDSQDYPPILAPFYPTTGDFLAFVGDLNSRELVHTCTRTFRAAARLPAQGLSAPQRMPGVNLSDHASFWMEGIPAVMVTDTAFFRNRHYHRASDLPVTLDPTRLTHAVLALHDVIQTLAAAPTTEPPQD